MDTATDRGRLSLATRLAKIHRVEHFVFWTADDWKVMHGVRCVRTGPGSVLIRVHPVGQASLDVGLFPHN